MERFTGLIGIILIFVIAYLMSNNRKVINYRLVFSGLAIQITLALFILKVPIGKEIFVWLGNVVTKVVGFSSVGAEFVFGVLVKKELLDKAFGPGNNFIFFFQVVPTIIFVAALVSAAYYLGIMQRIVKLFAFVVYKIMGASGSEAVSNVASAFVGQIEAQIMIKPFLRGMTMSELLASMTGSLACLSGAIMAVYIALGVPAEYLIAASIMAAPGALVISKIVWPETEISETKEKVSLEIKETNANMIDAIAHGAGEGLKIGMSVFAMLIGFIAIIALLDYVLGKVGLGLGNLGLSLAFIGIDINTLSLNQILGALFSVFARVMGVPLQDIHVAGSLMGTKMVLNEFVAYLDLTKIKDVIHPKTLAIVSFALCGFANFSSVAMLIGGVGELAPTRRTDLAKLGMKALICGTLASYLSATIAGILI